MHHSTVPQERINDVDTSIFVDSEVGKKELTL